MSNTELEAVEAFIALLKDSLEYMPTVYQSYFKRRIDTVYNIFKEKGNEGN